MSWNCSLSNSPSNECSGMISFRIDRFDFLAVQGTLKCLLHLYSPKASILRCSAFLWSNSHICTSFATPWSGVHQAPLSMGFPRQEYWNRLPFPFPGDIPNPGIELESPASPALAGGFFTSEPPGKPKYGKGQSKFIKSFYMGSLSHNSLSCWFSVHFL